MEEYTLNKLKILIILFSSIYLSKYILISMKTEIIIDNRINFEKEDNIDFSKFSTTIKPIALYNISNSLTNINKADNDQNSIKYNTLLNKIKRQIIFAKNHGIYGFAFNYILTTYNNTLKIAINMIIENKNWNIKYFLILEKENKTISNNNLDLLNFCSDIKKYILDKRYIKINNMTVLGINNKDINTNDIYNMKIIFKEKGLGEIFFLSMNYDEYFYNKNITDGILYSIEYNSLEKVFIKYNKTKNFFYTHLIYNNLFQNKFNYSNKVFRISISLSSNYPILVNNSKLNIYSDYSPEKFYLLNKIIIDWIEENHKIENQFIPIDNFENLEKDHFLGYANINYFSRALYELPIIKNHFYLNDLQNKVSVFVQAHVFYIDLIDDIVNKTNNIPVPFDLFITTNTEEKKTKIQNFLNINSKAKNFEILITENKGRDVIPFLIQIKDKIRNYKYFCHIHTKKHGKNKEIGKYWQSYLYENLLGNNNTIAQILSDFENNNKLGFIFPENFYEELEYSFCWNYLNLKHINHVLKILFPKKNYKVGKYLHFPVGNMFWARTKAVYQIFNNKIIKLAPKEKGQLDKTILHAIERLWLYLVKINGFYYKTFIYYI